MTTISLATIWSNVSLADARALVAATKFLDIQFAEASGKKLTLDVTVPQRVSKPSLVVMIHEASGKRS